MGKRRRIKNLILVESNICRSETMSSVVLQYANVYCLLNLTSHTHVNHDRRWRGMAPHALRRIAGWGQEIPCPNGKTPCRQDHPTRRSLIQPQLLHVNPYLSTRPEIRPWGQLDREAASSPPPPPLPSTPSSHRTSPQHHAPNHTPTKKE